MGRALTPPGCGLPALIGLPSLAEAIWEEPRRSACLHKIKEARGIFSHTCRPALLVETGAVEPWLLTLPADRPKKFCLLETRGLRGRLRDHPGAQAASGEQRGGGTSSRFVHVLIAVRTTAAWTGTPGLPR